MSNIDFDIDYSSQNQHFTINGLGLPSRWLQISQESHTLKSIQLGEKTIEKYLGKYSVQDAFIFEVIKEGDKIYGQVGNDRHEILPYRENRFFAIDIDARLVFNLDDKGAVLGLTLLQNQEMHAIRTN